MNRDELIIAMRPDLGIQDEDKTPIESFQNQTLRPILKMQHELTLRLLYQHKNYKSKVVLNMTLDQYRAFITKYLQSNLDLRNQLLGTIVGLFSSEDLDFYLEHRKEVNRRIIQMQGKRFVDSF